jgi:hypothetical protein
MQELDSPNTPQDAPADSSARTIEILADRQGQVDLQTDLPRLADYLQNHRDWIDHCFKPLKVEALSANTYKLQFFRIGGLGFELEPCFGVKIWADEGNIFRLSSIELPSDAHLPYKVDCQSYFRLEELSRSEGQDQPDQKEDSHPTLTRVHWDLQLCIQMELPGFLLALPRNLVHRVGTKVVVQVTRSMSDRLTHNVCTDFYKSIGKAGHKYRLVDTKSRSSDPAPSLTGDAP